MRKSKEFMNANYMDTYTVLVSPIKILADEASSCLIEQCWGEPTPKTGSCLPNTFNLMENFDLAAKRRSC